MTLEDKIKRLKVFVPFYSSTTELEQAILEESSDPERLIDVFQKVLEDVYEDGYEAGYEEGYGDGGIV